MVSNPIIEAANRLLFLLVNNYECFTNACLCIQKHFKQINAISQIVYQQ